MGGTPRVDSHETPASADRTRPRRSEGPWQTFTASAVNLQKGSFAASTLASAIVGLRRSTRPQASARDQVKLAAMFASTPPFVAAGRDGQRLRPTTATTQTARFESPASTPTGFAQPTTKTQHSRPRAEAPKNGSAALATCDWVALPRKYAQHATRIRDSSASRCGHTLKWRPRIWEAERSRCLLRFVSGRST